MSLRGACDEAISSGSLASSVLKECRQGSPFCIQDASRTASKRYYTPPTRTHVIRHPCLKTCAGSVLLPVVVPGASFELHNTAGSCNRLHHERLTDRPACILWSRDLKAHYTFLDKTDSVACGSHISSFEALLQAPKSLVSTGQACET